MPDPVFQLNGFNVRQVGGIQSPSVINAVFNHRNFWNGRAQPDFNGVNPFGARDLNARVWVLSVTGSPTQIDIRIRDAGLASQAVGPPMNELEMAAAGRTFPHLGKKLLLRKPLGLQAVHPNDSVLGVLADTTFGAKGLRVSYAALIQQAFKPKWWNSTKTVSIGGQNFTMMQANFPLYWGLALMLYESTLVSDDTPIDRYLATRTIDPITGQISDGDSSAFDPLIARLADEGTYITRDNILAGLGLFELPVAPQTIAGAGVPSGFGAGCTACHLGAELTSASVRNLVTHGLEAGDVVFRNAGFDGRMERMFMQLPPVPAGSDQITYNPATYEVKVTRTNGVAEPAPRPVRGMPSTTLAGTTSASGRRPITSGSAARIPSATSCRGRRCSRRCRTPRWSRCPVAALAVPRRRPARRRRVHSPGKC